MKLSLTLFALQIGLLVFGQNILKGTVKNENNEAIPGVKVYIENTTYGVITDYSGNYFLELKEQKRYPVVFNMLGMSDTVVNIFITNKVTEFDLVLKNETQELESVEVSATKIKVGNSIIKKVQKNRKKLGHQFENYTCTTYLKTGLEKEKRKPKESDSITEGPVKMSLIESVSISTFIPANTYHEKILAQHDYSDKEDVKTSSAIDYFMDDIITPVQSIKVDPYIFFEKVQDGDFNLYQNMINLPKISENPITSPIGVQAFTNYKFELIGIFHENGQKIYEIQVTPRFKNAPLFEGSLYIIDEIFVIKSFNLSINPACMPFFKSFTVIQDYEEIDGNWVPVRREFSYLIQEKADHISANTRVSHSNYIFNQSITPKDFKNELSSYADDAFSKDSMYWVESRPILLKVTELAFIAEQNRIDSIKQSEHYLDSIDAVFNKITFGDVLFNGVGLRNRFKKQEIFIRPVVGSIDVFGVGGYRYIFGGSYSKKFDNAHKIKLSPNLNYGFLNKDLKPDLSVEYTFLPLIFGTIELEGGDTYDKLTNQLSAVNYVFGGNSSVRNRFIGIGYRQEIVNGLYGRIKFNYANKEPLGDLDLGPIMQALLDMDTLDFDLINDPIDFEPYQIAMVEFKLQYRFKQKYIIKNNEKLIIGSVYPELELNFKQGIPKLFNSEVSFNSIEFKVSDEINFGNYGDSKWKVIGGSFLNKKDLRVIEHKYFKPADGGFLSNPINTHQTLDTMFHTDGAYLQVFYLHHFNGFFLNKVPLINKLKLESVIGTSLLMIDEFDYSHSEFFVGIERKVKIRKEYVKFGFYYTGRFNDITEPYFRFKIGVDIFNTFTNKWSY